MKNYIDEFKVNIGFDQDNSPFYYNLNEFPYLQLSGANLLGKEKLINIIMKEYIKDFSSKQIKFSVFDSKKSSYEWIKKTRYLHLKYSHNEDEFTKLLSELISESKLRYQNILNAGVFNWADYNKKNKKKLAVILLIINDLSTLNKSTIDKLILLKSRSRASGIYLIGLNNSNSSSIPQKISSALQATFIYDYSFSDLNNTKNFTTQINFENNHKTITLI